MRWLTILILSVQALYASKSPETLGIRAILIAGVKQMPDSVYTITEGNESLMIWLDASPRQSFVKFTYELVTDEKITHAETDSIQINIYQIDPGNTILKIAGITTEGKAIALKPISLYVKKTWFRSTWFWALCLFMLLGAFFGSERFLKKFEEDDEKNQKKIAGLELKTLQLQMNPHFIFNALNSIQSFIINNDALKANDYLSKFARLIRMFLDSSRARFITIEDEAELLLLYCEMEKLRFESKFDFKISIGQEVDKSLQIPTMILQPFLENAINHGLRFKEGRGFVEVNFIDNTDEIVCKVSDNGIGRKRASMLQNPDRTRYKSQGLRITTERIANLNRVNNSKLGFEISDLYDESEYKDVGTVVSITFPKHID